MLNFYDPEFRKFCAKEFQIIRERRKSFKGKPDEFDMLDIVLDRAFERFYAKVLAT